MRRLAVLTAVLLLAAGCARATDPPAAAPAVTVSATPSRAAAPLGDYDTGHDPAADIEAALATARADRRNVLIDFGADWCPDCRVLAKLGTSSQVAPVLDKDYHVVSVDIGQFDKHLDVARRYHLDLGHSGIPALVVLDPRGTVREVTNDGSFANARTMSAAQVAGFLTKWAPVH